MSSFVNLSDAIISHGVQLTIIKERKLDYSSAQQSTIWFVMAIFIGRFIGSCLLLIGGSRNIFLYLLIPILASFFSIAAGIFVEEPLYDQISLGALKEKLTVSFYRSKQRKIYWIFLIVILVCAAPLKGISFDRYLTHKLKFTQHEMIMRSVVENLFVILVLISIVVSGIFLFNDQYHKIILFGSLLICFTHYFTYMSEGDKYIYTPAHILSYSLTSALSESLIYTFFVSWIIFCLKGIEGSYMAFFFLSRDIGNIIREVLNVTIAPLPSPTNNQIKCLVAIALLFIFIGLIAGYRMVFLLPMSLRDEYRFLSEPNFESGGMFLETNMGSIRQVSSFRDNIIQI